MKNSNQSEANRLRDDADKARDQGNWSKAEQKFEAYLNVASEDAPLWVQLGHARKELGDLKGAEKAYIRSLSIAPDVADTHIMLGHLRKQMGKLAQAAACYAEAVELEPDALDPRLQLAFAEKDLQHFDAALAHFRIAHAADPTNQEVVDLVMALGELTSPELAAPESNAAATEELREFHEVVRALAFEVQSLKGRMNGMTKTIHSLEGSLEALQTGVRKDQKSSADRFIQLEAQTPNVSQSLSALMDHLGIERNDTK